MINEGSIPYRLSRFGKDKWVRFPHLLGSRWYGGYDGSERRALILNYLL